MGHRNKARLNFEQQLEGMVVLWVQDCELSDILTRLSAEHIPVFQIVPDKNRLYFTIYLDDFNAVRRLLRQAQIRFHIGGKRGLPFMISRLKRRKGLWLGVLCCVFMGHLLLSLLWNYEVSGNERYSDTQIIAMVQAYGLWPGSHRTDLDLEALEHEIELDHPEFTWVQFDWKGTTLCISVKERLSNEADLSASGSIVAKADGVLTELLVYTGTEQAAVGESVIAGQVIIGGWDYPERIRNGMGVFVDAGEPYAVRAKGVVRGQIAHKAIGVCALEESGFVKTGKTDKNTAVFWNNHSLFSFGPAASPYAYSKDSSEQKSLFRWGQWQCPIVIKTVIYEEQMIVHRSYTPEEAYQTAVERARRQLQQEMAQDAVMIRESSGMRRTAEDGTIQAEVVWIVDEPIGQMKQISLPAEKINHENAEN